MSDDDLPSDFFDDLEKQDFLEYLDSDDDRALKANPAKKRRSASRESSGPSDVDILEKQSNVQQEIQRLERDIAERRKKLYRSTRSPRKSRSRSRSRSNSPIRRSSYRKSRDRDRPRYRRSRSRNRRRSKSRSSRHRTTTAGHSISFLEELAQTFAQQGKSFPEADELKYGQGQRPAQATPVYPANSGITNPQAMMYQQQQIAVPQQAYTMAYAYGQQNILQYPVANYQPSVPAAYPTLTEIKTEKDDDTIPPSPSIDYGRENLTKKNTAATDEILKKAAKEKVLTRCWDAVKSLRHYKYLPIAQRFFYTPTIVTGPNESISPAHQTNNVLFKFSKRDVDETKMAKTISPSIKNIVTILGYDCNLFREKLKPKTNIVHSADVIIVNDALPKNLSISTFTQTEEMFCDKCIKNSLRSFKDASCETRVGYASISCQTALEDIASISEMTPVQLRAINDFGQILKTGIAPKNYRESVDLRDRLYNIYETCTGIRSNLYLRDNESRMEFSSASRQGSTPELGDGFVRRPEPPISNQMLTSKQIMELECREGRNSYNNPHFNSSYNQQYPPGNLPYPSGNQQFAPENRQFSPGNPQFPSGNQPFPPSNMNMQKNNPKDDLPQYPKNRYQQWNY